MLNRIINEKICCGLDIGSQKIKASILKSKDSMDEKVTYEHRCSKEGPFYYACDTEKRWNRSATTGIQKFKFAGRKLSS